MSKVSRPDFILVVDLKKELSLRKSRLLQLFFRLLQGLTGVPCILNCWETFCSKKYLPLSLLSVVSEVLLANNRLVDHLEKGGLCSDIQYGFRSF